MALALGVYTVFASTDSNYRTVDNLYAMIEGMALLGLVAMGLAVTMIAGELDFSVGSVAAVSGILAIRFADYGLVPALLVATVPAVIFGATQGFLIARLRINSLVFTIGTMIAVRGLAYIVSNEKSWTLPLAQLDLSDLVVLRIGIFSPFSLTTIGVFLVLAVVLGALRQGREIYAVGGGRSESVGAGISTTRPLILAFALSAGLSALAGALSSLKSGSATPYGFEGIMLAAVTAALIGGVSLYGGRGSVFGIALGVVTLRLLISGMSSRGAPYYLETFATGILLIVFLAFEWLTGTESGRRALAQARLLLRRARAAPA
jgi:ribose/xylose/arabinose/galactoside ABC-type transport system permease subunit